jgi:hypothetical protein
LVVEAKTEVEKLREQGMNVEWGWSKWKKEDYL